MPGWADRALSRPRGRRRRASGRASLDASALRQRKWGVLAGCGAILSLACVLTLWSFPLRFPPAKTASQYRSIGSYFNRDGDRDRAEEWATMALDLEPDNVNNWGGLGRILLDGADRYQRYIWL